MDIPKGATHKHECYGITTFYARMFIRYNSVSETPCEPIFGWFSWTGKEWQKETCVSSRDFVKLD